jgi:NAD+ kinase
MAVEERMMLGARLVRGGQTVSDHIALNDVVITKSAMSRIIDLAVSVDGRYATAYRADGLIISTPTGSTAYNLSVGGPILFPTLDAVVLTPIAPHTLTNRPLVLPANASIALRPLIETMSDIVVTFDGQYGAPLEAGDVVRVRRSPAVLRLIHTSRRTHFEMLREKLQWGR